MDKKLRYKKEDLDRTRKNLGDLSAKEAQEMMKRLGGEVGDVYEGNGKSAPIRRTAPIVRGNGDAASGSSASRSSSVRSGSVSASSAPNPPRYKAILPYIDGPTFKQFIKLYFNSYFKIMSFGNYLGALFSSGNSEKVSLNFTRKIIWDNLALLQEFKTEAEEIVQGIPGGTTALQSDSESLYARFLLAVLNWDFAVANQHAHKLTRLGKDVSVVQVVPLIREIYRNVISVVFVTDGMLAEILDSIEKLMQTSPDSQIREIRKQLTKFKTDWKQILSAVIKGFYPILMRACLKECLPINSFFSSHITKILDFLGANRFQLVLQKNVKTVTPNPITSTEDGESLSGESKDAADEENNGEDATDEEKEEETTQSAHKRAQNQILRSQFDFANILFPDAGWYNADLGTDFYAYFHPIFEFEEGANLIAPNNPMQFTFVLVRIIEDLFSGIHHVDFFNDSVCKIDFEEMRSDIQNWYLYSADFMSKTYFPMLREFVDNMYSNTNYAETVNGRRMLARIFWEQKSFILPYYKFELSYMPNESKKRNIKPLYKTVHTLSSNFVELSSSIDKSLRSSGGKFLGQINGIGNPWDEYSFALANPLSRRLNAILGGKMSPKRNNANLIKTISAFLFILDWWLNDKNSPAYDEPNAQPYRHKPQSTEPDFNIPLRTNVNEIFVNNIKAMAQQAAKNATEEKPREGTEEQEQSENPTSGNETAEAAPETPPTSTETSEQTTENAPSEDANSDQSAITTEEASQASERNAATTDETHPSPDKTAENAEKTQ